MADPVPVPSRPLSDAEALDWAAAKDLFGIRGPDRGTMGSLLAIAADLLPDDSTSERFMDYARRVRMGSSALVSDRLVLQLFDLLRELEELEETGSSRTIEHLPWGKFARLVREGAYHYFPYWEYGGDGSPAVVGRLMDGPIRFLEKAHDLFMRHHGFRPEWEEEPGTYGGTG